MPVVPHPRSNVSPAACPLARKPQVRLAVLPLFLVYRVCCSKPRDVLRHKRTSNPEMGAVGEYRAIAANTKPGILLMPIEQSSHRCGIEFTPLLWKFPFLQLGHRIRKVLADTDRFGHIATRLVPRRLNQARRLD